MLITPDPSPNRMRINAATPTAQPEEMAEDIFDEIETPLTPTHQRDEEWRVPMIPPPTTITRIHAAENAAVTRAGEPLDSKIKNWSGWSQSM
jgi:hypothetical protein